jgi:hypothetical protein
MFGNGNTSWIWIILLILLVCCFAGRGGGVLGENNCGCGV